MDHRDASVASTRAVTLKSVLFGLLGIFLISGFAGLHDTVMFLSPLMVGTHLPAGAFFFLVLVALLWNSVTSRTVPALTLSSQELMVVMGMTLMGCFPPTSGLCRYFQRQLTLPWFYLAAGGRVDWEKFQILQYLPPKLFPVPAPQVTDMGVILDDLVYRGFFTGLALGSKNAALSDIPLAAWLPPLLYWGPLILFMSLCVMSLSLLVHQQWSHHEQLSYPLAHVATSFIARAHGRGIPDIFKSRLFWWGFTPVFLLYLLHYLHLWFPDTVPGMGDVLPSVKSWSLPVNTKIPVLKKVPSSWLLGNQSTYFSVVGLAYFVSGEISLSMGLSHILLAVTGIWYFLGTGTPLSGNDVAYARSGAYVGYALILLYTGRNYYWSVLKGAIGLRTAGIPRNSASVLAARLVVLAFTGFVIMLVLMGLDWMIALLFALVLMLLFLVFTRIICETGIPLMQTAWWPGYLLVSLMGPAAIGPGPLVFIMHLGTILCQDPRECLMPYVATGIRMADDARLPIRKVFWVLVIAMVVALSVGFVSTTWTYYNVGAMSSDSYAHKSVPLQGFDEAARHISELHEVDMLDTSAARSGLAKLGLLAPDGKTIGFVIAGLVAVMVMSLLRFRFTKFPLHPVIFLVWGSWAAMTCWASFLIGWGAKMLVVKFGGGRVYQGLRPIFIGLIAGELIAVGLSILFEMVYYGITGNTTGLSFRIMVQ